MSFQIFFWINRILSFFNGLILETHKPLKSFIWTSSEKFRNGLSHSRKTFAKWRKTFYTHPGWKKIQNHWGRALRGPPSRRRLELMSGMRQAPWICGSLPRPLRQCFSLNQAHLQADGGNLYVAIDVEAIVFGGENHRTVVHQRNVEALRVLYLRDQVYKT